MTLPLETLRALAEHIESAELGRSEIAKITDAYPELSWSDAYQVQDLIRERKQKRGTRVTGLKMGLTSFAKMRQMGVDNPIHGFITDYGAIADGGEVRFDELIHPKVEAEIAFVLNRPLSGPGVHIGQVLAATEFIAPAIEVIDSRYKDFRFDLKSVIADNTSAARYAIGGRACAVAGIDLKNIGIVLEKNGRVIATASGASVLGNPAASVAMLANLLGTSRRAIPAGVPILTGGATEAFLVERGDHIRVRCEHLGDVSLHIA